MPGKFIGEPCPKCAAILIRRRRASLFRATDGDVAYCAPCNAAWDIEGEAPLAPADDRFAAIGFARL
ncbi:MAG: hypothetical protein IV086_12115 [Hyphomonadaceae bacterium]|nr:MAG: hypothetical protein FD160_1549 [Caulobacteraceae bacterium]MBT9446436.1 hypothetical protein [Hyphomonadaceae bacterium]